MNRTDAIAADNHAMDELARISRELETVNLLIVHFRQQPRVVRRLADIRVRLLIARTDARARRANAAEYI